MFGLGSFFYIITLLLNAIAILSEDRFLARIGLSSATANDAFGAGPGGGSGASFQSKAVTLIASVRMVTRIPLMLANTVIIVYELVLG
ncbi:Yos1-like protein [Echria macrotheca]|uniref:Yos1-like protein n=1 Tax=Echria macrotheca TaxID=438768 RepID=A0AAJ0BBA2_9PEZI|nr:Yos1-like protein [Echria macrotheca]